MKNFEPMDIETFNQVPGKANCMLFAFSQKKAEDKSILDYNLWGFRSTPIKEIVEKAALDFGIVLRKVASIDETPKDKYLIAFYLKAPNSECGEYDYHFTRRELNGKWVEVSSWGMEASLASSQEELRTEFGSDPTYFVVEGVV